MNKPLAFLWIVVGATLLPQGGTSQALPVSSHDGTWSGTTSQDKKISFTVADGLLRKLSLEWRLPLDQVCATALGSPIVMTAVGGSESFFWSSPKSCVEERRGVEG